MNLIDTHAHLLSPELTTDLHDVLSRARAAGVRAIVCVCESLAESRAALELAASRQLVHACAGVHPDRAAGSGDPQALLAEVDAVCALARSRREELIAIGEVGLDYWRAGEPAERELQQEMLRRFVALARELDLPLSVHSRSAGRQTIELLLSLGARRVILHAFDGRASAAEPGVAAGYFFSVPPSVVRSAQKQKLVRRLPLDCLLLETDSPVLGADPESRNEPANVLIAAREVARLHGCSLAEVAERTTASALRAFGPSLLAPLAPLAPPRPA